MTAGVSLTTGGFLFTSNDLDLIEDESIRYETIIIDKEDTQPRTPLPPFVLMELEPAPWQFVQLPASPGTLLRRPTISISCERIRCQNSTR